MAGSSGTGAAPLDDLSSDAGLAQPSIARANAALRDAEFRSYYRTAATVVAIAAIVALLIALLCLVTAVRRNLSVIQFPEVALCASLLVALTVLIISLLRATFLPMKSADEAPEVTIPGGEHLKALRDMLDVVLKPGKS